MHNEGLKVGQNMAADWDARAEDNALYFIAEVDDEAEFRASGEGAAATWLLNDVTPAADATVLDIGCGIGRIMRPMAARFKRVIGVDVSPKMIEQSREYLVDLTNVETYANDGSSLPEVADNSVDFCYSFICFQHIPRKEFITSYLREALRVLKPGGIFKFQVDGESWPGRPRDAAETWQGVWYTPNEIRQTCLELGYSVLYVTGGGTQHLWVLCQKPTATRVRGLMGQSDWHEGEKLEQRREDVLAHPEAIRSVPLKAEALTNLRIDMNNRRAFTVACRQRFYLFADLTNFSDCVLASAPPNPVFISYHWMDAAAAKTVIYDGLRSGIYPPLEPGLKRTSRVEIEAPPQPGSYVLRLTFVQEGVRWFDFPDIGIKSDIAVEVK